MRGDYTRFSFEPRKRYAAVQQQQGRVQLDSDWNEAASIERRRTRLLGLDLFGRVGIGTDTTPNAFFITPIAGPPVDLGIAPGRIYVDGLLAECFPEDVASYLKQPFLPDPPALPAGDALVYLDIWEREVTWVQDNNLLDPALGGRDTTTRLQTVWQVKVTSQPGATCGMPVGAPASAGRLTSSAIAPPTPDDPCLLPPVAGYRGLENRLYRVEIHNGGAMGTARFKWSRDNGSIVSAVSSLTVAGGQTQLTVNRLGRDAVLGFAIGNWVTVTDDNRELAEEPGEMARIVDIQPATNGITLDRAIPTGGSRPFGADPAEIAARHTRIQRWDQTATTNTVDGDGLIATGPGVIPLEDGAQVELSLDPVGGTFNVGDWWVFAARVATASVGVLTKAPPRGNLHHYVQLAAVTGLGGAGPTATDCRPAKVLSSDCCCTVVVSPGQDIQKAIDSLPGVGGCVCLRAGVHLIRQTLRIDRANVKLEGESPGTTVILRGDGPTLVIGGKNPAQRIEVTGIDFERTGAGGMPTVIGVTGSHAIRIDACAARANGQAETFGIIIDRSQDVAVTSCIIEGAGAGGVWVNGENTQDILLADNMMAFDQPTKGATVEAIYGILSQTVRTGLRIVNNTITGVYSGIVVNDTPGEVPNSFTTIAVHVVDNNISCGPADALGGALVLFGIDLTAPQSIAENNVVRLPEGSDGHTGIRIAGWGTQAIGNTIYGAGTTGVVPIGIQVGYSGTATAVPTSNVRICNNFISYCPVGIFAMGVIEGLISGNAVSFNGTDATTLGIAIETCVGVGVEANEIAGFAIGGASMTGVANRFSDNNLSNGGVGLFLGFETGAVIAENRIAVMVNGGIGGLALIARTDISNNRISNCAMAGNATSAIGILISYGPVRIAGNEVLDTGISAAGAATPVYGIRGILVQTASVDGNQVTYTSPYTRVATAEDRALIMQGLMELDYNTGAAQIVYGFPIRICNNSFVGTGQTALVEVLQNKLNDLFNERFERVLFSNNYCEHVTAANPPKGAATVKLVGSAASVVGNQIKSLTRFTSVDFGGMPGSFAANVINGPAVNHSNTPPPDGGLNVTI